MIVAGLLELMDKIMVTPGLEVHCYVDQHFPERLFVCVCVCVGVCVAGVMG